MKIKIKHALISVSNKDKIVGFAKALMKSGIEIISTGGTYAKLADASVKVKKVEEITGFPEMMDGRVKTLHPFIHGGILADRSNSSHMEEAKRSKIKLIDMVVVNLYPFKETISRPDVPLEEAVENIDIGGPTMIRSAAKNYKGAAVIVDPRDYKAVLEELKASNGYLSEETCFRLSVKAFQHTCEYDSVIFNYFIDKTRKYTGSNIKVRPDLEIDDAGKGTGDLPVKPGGKFNKDLKLSFKKIGDLRYGENPHQEAAYYKSINAESSSFAESVQLQGKALSYNNILDSNAAFSIVREFEEPCVAVIKHNNPCGAAISARVEDAYRKAYECDPVSAFGSVVAANVKWTGKAASFMADKYVEVVIAPDFDKKAIDILSAKKDLRILKIGFDKNQYISRLRSSDFQLEGIDLKSIDGGLLVQDLDEGMDGRDIMKVVTDIKPTRQQWDDLLFGWQVAKNVKSNAIVLTKNGGTVGVGAGQMSRIDAAKIAIDKSGSRSGGAVLSSDAFLPFEDVVEVSARNGISAIIQPGGSIRDREVIEAANKNKILMVFTGKRHFKH